MTRGSVTLKTRGFVGLVYAAGLVLATASVIAPALAAQAPAAGPNPLPLRRVILFKSGVAHFEHLGKVRGNQEVTISFTSGQLDDVLKSLTALDLDGGRVSGIHYNSQETIDRRLGALRLPVGQQATRAQFLGALRGARLEVQSGSQRLTGRLLSVETTTRRIDGATMTVETIALVSDAGDIRTVALDPGVNVRLLDRELSDEVSKYLSLVGSVRDQDVRRLAIATVGTGDRDLLVSYVSEAPVWKSTYRLVLPAPGDTREPLLQGWAVVDNTGGEDWQDVELSLVAGAPQAFVQQISKPYYVRRPTVALPGRFQQTPQTHQAALNRSLTIDGISSSALLRSNDGLFSIVTPKPDATEEVKLTTASAGADATGAGAVQLRYVSRSGTYEDAVRQQLSAANAGALGDLFEYKIKEPVTIRKGQSALVPILTGSIGAEKVSIWNAKEGAGRPLRAIWITNTTGLTLDAGSVSVIDGAAFAGEGLIDPLKPGERRLLSFAGDLGLTVDASDDEDTDRVTTVRVARGVIRQEVEERRSVTYTVRNQDAERKTLILEHRNEDGWKLATLKPVETTPQWHRFRIELAPKATTTLVVEETHPLHTELKITALTDDQLSLFIRQPALDPALETALRDIQTRKVTIANLTRELQRRRAEVERIAQDQLRVRENMRALKGSAEERLLIRRYVQQLDTQETRLKTLTEEVSALAAQIEKANMELALAIEAIVK